MISKIKKSIVGVVCIGMLARLVSGNVNHFALADRGIETTVSNLTTNYESNPMGVETDNIRFSWKMDSNLIGAGQSAYQIIVSKDGEVVWDSETVKSDQSVGIPYNGDPLKLETDYSWYVIVTDQEGNQISSEEVYFSTETSWGDEAKWIIPESYEDGAPMLRTERSIKENIKTARLYISALGIYEAYINGQPVQNEIADDVLNPGWTDYLSFVNYQTYDVTDLIEGDRAAIGVLLGNGWYAGEIGIPCAYEDVIGENDQIELALIAKLVIDYADGSQDIIGTDEDWTSSDQSPIVYNDFYHGETYDSAREKGIIGWNTIDFDDSNWNGVYTEDYVGELMPGSNAALAHIDTELSMRPISGYIYNPDETKSSTEYADGIVVKQDVKIDGQITIKAGQKLVLNMGQNMTGVVRAEVSGAEGTTLTLRYAEALNDGKTGDGPKDSLYFGTLRSAEATDNYILSDADEQSYQPMFTYHGFQYVEVSADADIILNDLEGLVITSVGEQTGTLKTSNADVNQLISNTLWSQIDNFTTVPTDCPQRAERWGWTGDIQLFAPTATYNYDVTRFLENYSLVMNANAARDNDIYPPVIPGFAPGQMYDWKPTSGWADAGIIIPWILYQKTGDLALIKQGYQQMDAYMDTIDEYGYSTMLFGDWLGFWPCSVGYMNTVYRAYTAEIMKEMAILLEDSNSQEKYQRLYDETKKEFLSKYPTEDGQLLCASADGVLGQRSMNGYDYCDNTQTAFLWALKLGFYENEDQKEAMIKRLVENIRNEGESIRAGYPENSLGVGFLGVNVLLPVLSEIGQSNVAYDLLLQDTMPSWLFAVQNGATTIWESWSTYSYEEGLTSTSMNHYAYGSCLEWMYEYMIGIQQEEGSTGYKQSSIQPVIDESGRITYAEGTYNSYYGTLESKWTAKSGKLSTYDIVIPANTTATLYLPADKDISINEMPSGIVFKEITNRKDITVAMFLLEAGGYNFTVENGIISAAIIEGYLTPEDSTPNETEETKDTSQTEETSETKETKEPSETEESESLYETKESALSTEEEETKTDTDALNTSKSSNGKKGGKVPTTGDNSMAIVFIIMLTVSFGGAVIIIQKKQREN